MQLYPSDLKRMVSAIVLLAIKDLGAYRFTSLGPQCPVETARTAWLLIFDINYRMLLGSAKLSLQDMLDIVSGGMETSIIDNFRTLLKAKIITTNS